MEIHDTTNLHGRVVERKRCGPHEMVRYDNGEPRFRCITGVWDIDGDSEVVIGALGIPHHEITWPEGGVPDISPSILVPRRGPPHHRETRPLQVQIHGFIRDGVWEPCSDDRSINLDDFGG